MVKMLKFEELNMERHRYFTFFSASKCLAGYHEILQSVLDHNYYNNEKKYIIVIARRDIVANNETLFYVNAPELIFYKLC